MKAKTIQTIFVSSCLLITGLIFYAELEFAKAISPRPTPVSKVAPIDSIHSIKTSPLRIESAIKPEVPNDKHNQ